MDLAGVRDPCAKHPAFGVTNRQYVAVRMAPDLRFSEDLLVRLGVCSAFTRLR